MKKYVLIAALVMVSAAVFGQKTLWTTGNGRTLAAGQQEFGIIQPFQIGITDKVELSVSPLAGLSLVPNVSVKYRYTDGPWIIASQHTYMMPSMLLHSIQDGWFDFLNSDKYSVSIPSTAQIPYIFTFRNQVLVTRRLALETLLTGKAGIEFSLKTKGTTLPALTYPLIYLQSTTFNEKVVWFAGARLDHNLYKDFNIMAEVDFVSSGFDVAHWAVEHKGYFIWNQSIKFAALIGYRMSYGTYPDPPYALATNKNRYFIFPVADLIWKLNIKRVPDKGLFGPVK